MDMDNGWKPMAIIFFIVFWGMTLLALFAINERDRALEFTAKFQGKSLVCRIEERH